MENYLLEYIEKGQYSMCDPFLRDKLLKIVDENKYSYTMEGKKNVSQQ